MSALAGIVVMALAVIGAVRVIKVSTAAARRALAALGRMLAKLEPSAAAPAKVAPAAPAKVAPPRDAIAAVASLAAKRKAAAS